MKVKVVNQDHREYSELFRDQMIVIPANGSIEMGRSEAIKFLSQASPMTVDGQGKAIKPKKLKIVEDPEAHAAARHQPIKYSAPDGTDFRTGVAYKEHLKKMGENNVGEPVRRQRAPHSSKVKI
jgi:hypothetical protein